MQIELFGTNTETLSPVALALPSGTERHIVSNGVRGTEQTIELMQGMVNSYKRNDEIRALCGKVIKDCAPKDYFCYAKKCYEWVRDNIKYSYDPHLVEYIESPKRLLKNRIGDCDSQDMLLCSMFENLGFEAQFVTIMADQNRQNEFTHVYTRVKIPKYGWIVADPIMPEKYFGWEPPYPNGKRYWHSATDEMNLPLDTSDSIAIAPNYQSTSDAVSGMGGMSGLEALGRGGHRHGGGGWGGRSANWFPNYGDGFDDSVFILPVAIPVAGQVLSASQYSTVSPSDTTPQQFENPMDDQSVGVSGLGFGDLIPSTGFTLNPFTWLDTWFPEQRKQPLDYWMDIQSKQNAAKAAQQLDPSQGAKSTTLTDGTVKTTSADGNAVSFSKTTPPKKTQDEVFDFIKENWKLFAAGFGALALFKIVTK